MPPEKFEKQCSIRGILVQYRYMVVVVNHCFASLFGTNRILRGGGCVADTLKTLDMALTDLAF